MGITGSESREPSGDFDALCASVAAGSGTVKLLRDQNLTWGLCVTLPPTPMDPAWRAGGFYFAALDELESHASVALQWLRSVRSPSLTKEREG
jgi:hypothetical protein